MKIRILLSGESSKLAYPEIRQTIKFTLNVLNVPHEFYEDKFQGFKVLQDDLNEPGYVWILNDSLASHLITDNPYIIISRNQEWLWSMPYPNCIGRMTQEMLLSVDGAVPTLMALLARCLPMRPQPITAIHTHHVVNMFAPPDLDAQGRIGAATATWRNVSENNPYYRLHYSDGDAPEGQLPTVAAILKDGLQTLESDDDILVFTNCDIALTQDATAIIRAYMESMQIDEVYFHRCEVDLPLPVNMLSHELNVLPIAHGIDGFAFRRTSKVLPALMASPLLIARQWWDWAWGKVVGNVLPFRICWHVRHAGEWTYDKKAQAGNKKNLRAAKELLWHAGLDVRMPQIPQKQS